MVYVIYMYMSEILDKDQADFTLHVVFHLNLVPLLDIIYKGLWYVRNYQNIIRYQLGQYY